MDYIYSGIKGIEDYETKVVTKRSITKFAAGEMLKENIGKMRRLKYKRKKCHASFKRRNIGISSKMALASLRKGHMEKKTKFLLIAS